MEIIKSISKNVRGSARKARIPAQVVTGMKVVEALPILQYMEKKAARDVWKVVKAAQADAVHNFQLNGDDLVVKSVRVDQAMRIKRFKPKARGMTRPIARPFCHITVELVNLTDKKPKEVKKSEKVVKKKSK